MSRATPDDQLKFLLSCVKHSNNGKIDFIEVAHECGVVSKGAAAKRYERLMKANGINPNGGPDPKPLPPTTPKETKKTAKDDVPRPPAKRRRVNKPAEKKQDASISSPSPPVGSKTEPLEKIRMEEEGSIGPANDLSMATTQHNNFEPQPNDETSFDFDEFCSPEMFAQYDGELAHPNQEDEALPVSASQEKSAVITGHFQEMVQNLTDNPSAEKQQEREMVIISD